MARRRLPGRGAATAEAPAPTPTPEPVAPVATIPTPTTYVVVDPPETPEPEESAALAPVQLGGMAPWLQGMLDKWTLPTNIDLDSDEGPGFSRIGFYTGRENAARGAKIIGDLGQVPEGTPYLYFDGTHYPMAGLRYVMLQTHAYWGAHGQKYELIKSYSEDPGKSALVNGAQVWIKECILAQGLVLPGNKAMPAGLEPAVVTLDTFRGALTRGPKDLLRAIQTSLTPAWAKQPGNGPLVSAPPMMRICADIKGTSKPTKDGTGTYVICSAFPVSVGPVQGPALAAWIGGAELQAEAADYDAEFSRRVADIKTKE